MIEMDEREKARFWTKAEATETCWNWKWSCGPKGYGTLGHRGKTMRAHRVAYELVNGEIPKGKSVLHSCDNPKCVNPDHLWIGTQQDNMIDRIKKGHFRLGKYSKYHGVKFRTDVRTDKAKRWGAYATVKGKYIDLGWFHIEEDAARMVDKYKIENLGIEYGLNFPMEKLDEK